MVCGVCKLLLVSQTIFYCCFCVLDCTATLMLLSRLCLAMKSKDRESGEENITFISTFASNALPMMLGQSTDTF